MTDNFPHRSATTAARRTCGPGCVVSTILRLYSCIGRRLMPHTVLECPVSNMINSDACPRPTTGGQPAERAGPGGQPAQAAGKPGALERPLAAQLPRAVLPASALRRRRRELRASALAQVATSGVLLSSPQPPSGGLIPSRSPYNRRAILIGHGNPVAEARTVRQPSTSRCSPTRAACGARR